MNEKTEEEIQKEIEQTKKEIEKVTNYQKKILYSQSSNYRFNILQNSINVINTSIDNLEFSFFNISDEISELFKDNNYFYDFLETSIKTFDKTNFKYIGYNSLVINALPYQFKPTMYLNEKLYIDIVKLYKKYFSNMSKFSIYKPIYDGFIVDTTNPSNYLKMCFDEESNSIYTDNIPFFYRKPVLNLSRTLVFQIITSLRNETRQDLVDGFEPSIFNLSENCLSCINNDISNFIIKNIFKDINFNTYYKTEISNAININKLNDLFKNYVDLYIQKDNIITCSNKIFANYPQHFAYLLMTKYKNDIKCVKFNIANSNYYAKVLEGIFNERDKIYAKRFELEGVVNLSFKFVNDHLQFINASLMSFNDWVDGLINNQIDNKDYIPVLSYNDISAIVKSINFDKELFIEDIEANFISDFLNSNTIELGVYEHVAKLVDVFIETSEFKNFILNELVIDLSTALQSRSPRAYKEIYNNIDNLISYIRYLLINKIIISSDLVNYFTEKYSSIDSIKNFRLSYLDGILTTFYDLNNILLKDYSDDVTRFTTSIATLLLLDGYIDKFRLNRKME